jgi:hypothetical protein
MPTLTSSTGVNGSEDVAGLEVDIRDHRDLGMPGDLRKRRGVVGVRYGDPHDLTAGCGQRGDLLQGCVDVGGLGGSHGLHRDRRAPADRDASDLQ